jgi:hypothetical protein
MKRYFQKFKEGIILGTWIFFALLLWWISYAIVNNIWTNPNSLEANPWNILTSENWNAILSNQNALSGALATLNWKVNTLSWQMSVINSLWDLAFKDNIWSDDILNNAITTEKLATNIFVKTSFSIDDSTFHSWYYIRLWNSSNLAYYSMRFQIPVWTSILIPLADTPFTSITDTSFWSINNYSQLFFSQGGGNFSIYNHPNSINKDFTMIGIAVLR